MAEYPFGFDYLEDLAVVSDVYGKDGTQISTRISYENECGCDCWQDDGTASD